MGVGAQSLRPIGITLSREVRQQAGSSVGAMVVDVGLGAAFIAFMVARRWGWDRVPPSCEPEEQDAGDHEGPPTAPHRPRFTRGGILGAHRPIRRGGGGVERGGDACVALAGGGKACTGTEALPRHHHEIPPLVKPPSPLRPFLLI